MKTLSLRLCALVVALATTGTALADHNFGIGVKAGTLGIGVEGTWRPLPYFDVRAGLNGYDYTDNGNYTGINYDAEINLDNYYVMPSPESCPAMRVATSEIRPKRPTAL